MRIALTIAGPYPALRGSQVLVGQLARGLTARGHDVHLVSWAASAPDSLGTRPTRLVRDLVLLARLARCVRRQGIDVIHAHNYEAAVAGLIVGRATGCPVVYHGHSAHGDELPTYFVRPRARRFAGRVGRFLDAQVPRRADFCIAVTEELGTVLRRRGVSDSALACIAPIGSPEDLGRPAEPRPSGACVCYAGNLDAYQNLGFLLRAFARVRQRVPAARLVLVTHAAPVRTPLGAGVEIVRAATYAEVRERLAAADVAVCPRVERSGFPMKLLNYMAAGKAIVAASGSSKGLVDGVTGRIVPDDDQEAFAEAIVDLLGSPPLRRRLGAAARRAVESPEPWEDVLDRVESIYRVVTAARAAAAGRVLFPARPV
jgi:glycosyltransferase involved in cell wall biosynthesis